MVSMQTIEALRKGVQRIGDAELKNELLGKVAEIQRGFSAVRERLQTQTGELEHLRARLDGNGSRCRALVYDPPV